MVCAPADHTAADTRIWKPFKGRNSICCYITSDGMHVCSCVCLSQSLLVAQQLANAVGGVMSGAAPGMNQPILIPFSAGGHLGGQQGLVLSLPTANIQSLVAAAAAGGIMTLPLQNLQGKIQGHIETAPSAKQGKHKISPRSIKFRHLNGHLMLPQMSTWTGMISATSHFLPSLQQSCAAYDNI